jgi:hypothetical protein
MNATSLTDKVNPLNAYHRSIVGRMSIA